MKVAGANAGGEEAMNHCANTGDAEDGVGGRAADAAEDATVAKRRLASNCF